MKRPLTKNQTVVVTKGTWICLWSPGEERARLSLPLSMVKTTGDDLIPDVHGKLWNLYVALVEEDLENRVTYGID